jgi:hypothetical protein
MPGWPARRRTWLTVTHRVEFPGPRYCGPVQRPAGWIRGPLPDAALALSWVPFAFAAHLTEDGGTASLRLLYGSVMFISFVHQPLTFPLVYASPWRLATHRRLFLWFPLLAVIVIAVAVQVSLTLVAVVGGIWNAEHILMQRFGITRFYGRKAGDDQGLLERWMLVAWFLLPLLWIAARGDLHHVLDRLSSGSVDAGAAGVLAKLTTEAGVALAGVVVAAAYLTVRWLVNEHRLTTSWNPGKSMYLLSTAGLFALAFFDPIAAVVGFVASHSIEYFALVNRSVASERQHVGLLAGIARRPHGQLAFFGSYVAAATLIFFLLYRAAPASVLLMAILTIGAVHFFYDAFIWKLRKAEVAASLGGPFGSPLVLK